MKTKPDEKDETVVSELEYAVINDDVHSTKGNYEFVECPAYNIFK